MQQQQGIALALDFCDQLLADPDLGDENRVFLEKHKLKRHWMIFFCYDARKISYRELSEVDHIRRVLLKSFTMQIIHCLRMRRWNRCLSIGCVSWRQGAVADLWYIVDIHV